MAVSSDGKVRERVNFSKILTSIQIPNLIEVQKKSYERFLQMNFLPAEREDIGSMVEWLSTGLFGRHVGNSAHYPASPR